MTRVFIGLGSNIEPERNLRSAVLLLAQRCHLVAVSRVYETAPVRTTDQRHFLNAAALIETEMSPAMLKSDVLRPIEDSLGRVRTPDKNAARTIDLDIALFGDAVLDVGQRHIPDPDILQFPHVAIPLADLAPQQKHPETGETLLTIAKRMGDHGIVALPDLTLWPQR